MNNASGVCIIEDSSQIASARRAVAEFGADIEFDESGKSNLAIVVTELGTNLLKHGGGGQIVFRRVSDVGVSGIEVIALDKGAGRADIDRCVADGFSTAGSSGTGLGAIRRLSSEFDIQSTPTMGTAVLSRLWAGTSTRRIKTGAVSLPISTEVVCGDAWEVVSQADRVLAIVADGLGHGPDAAVAAQEAIRVFLDQQNYSISLILSAIHEALRKTRGAAVSIASIDTDRQLLTFAGVGNVGGAVVGPGIRRNTVSMNGTAGQRTVSPREFTYPWDRDSRLIMHSDGLQTRWDTDAYPGLLCQDPGLLAGVLYRDHRRGSDDVTVLVVDAGSRL